ncbi:unnamed protein product [Mytilus edulis]|uniref:Uncharacterized protein n=1 Tax=Mytilus edulis TaxID=6550 RepID=A0A8S3VFN6_MYTED|nr:unnamed protein product [Mytilus edulis]
MRLHYRHRRGDVEVVWNDGRTTSHPILELKYDDGDAICYYHDNLPILGKCSNLKSKIQVDIWRNIQQERKLTFKPSLYLIFSDHPEVDAKDEKDENDDKASLMGEVIEFAKRTKLPCHVVGQKVLFHSGSTYSAFIHYNTGKDTVKKLVNRGFRRFGRGDVCLIDEDEINYFIRMAERM